MHFVLMGKQLLLQTIQSLILAGIILLVFKLYGSLVAAPRRLRRRLEQQGIGGPPPAFLLGNILEIKKSTMSAAPPSAAAGASATHDTGAALFPIFDKWRRQYGDIYTFSLGNKQMLLVNNYEVAKEVTTCISLDLGRPSFLAQDLEPLLGRGILTSNGNFWAYQRKILAPELFLDKVKAMTNLIQESASMLVDSWKGVIDAEGGKVDIKIDDYLRKFSSNVISRACFGSSHVESEQLFHKLNALQSITTSKGLSVGIPGMRYVPTRQNRRTWELQREVGELILKLVKQKNEENLEKNMLQMILQGAQSRNLSPDATEKFIIDNCKNIYMAGYETTANAAAWCLMLLASNPEWQDRVRHEVIGLCKGLQVPDFESIKQMKQLTMVINESLRLYPLAPILAKEALNDVEFANIRIPKEVTIWILTTCMHTDPAIWGPDSYQFNPGRFANGTTGACKLPHLFMPFGVGPRICLGLNLAMTELKILLSFILSNFSLTLSPKYIHAPVLNLNVEPRDGVYLVIEKLKHPVAAAQPAP